MKITEAHLAVGANVYRFLILTLDKTVLLDTVCFCGKIDLTYAHIVRRVRSLIVSCILKPAFGVQPLVSLLVIVSLCVYVAAMGNAVIIVIKELGMLDFDMLFL